jgi:threonine synthase
MTSHDAPGAKVIGIRGNFDDAQRGVKAIFASRDAASFMAERGMRLSSANSINIARLMPQIVYYAWGYREMRDSGALGADGLMDVAVPTGNFGNILAAWYAKQLGLPIGRLVCASNRNRVLSDFFGQNTYDRNRPFYKTESPSMDILVSSNLERLVFHATGDDPRRTAGLMAELAEKGRYSLSAGEAARLGDFRAGSADEAESHAAMRRYYENDRYLMDPHTAVAVAVLEKLRAQGLQRRPTLVASTASPFKFPVAVARAIGLPAAGAAGKVLDASAELDLAARLAEAAGLELPQAVRALRTAPIVHKTVVEAADMEAALQSALEEKGARS